MGPERPKPIEVFWVLRAQVGDREAFDPLFQWCERLLRPHVFAIVREPAAVEDILQNIFLTIYRKIRWLNDPDLFRPWVFRIATREALRYRRVHSDRREDHFDEAFAGASPEDGLANAVLSEQALRSLEDVSAESRAILSLHYLEDLSISEAAAILGIPVGTAKSRLARGIQKLKSLLTSEPLKGRVL